MTQAPTPGPMSAGTPAIRAAIALFRSAIKAGEAWSEDCAIAYRSALTELDELAVYQAPTAPVEASGSERDTALSILQAAVRSFDSGDTKNLNGVLDDILDALRPQPSGETREAVARIVASEFLRQDYEPDAKPEDVKFSDGLSWSYVDQGSVDFGEIADRVIAYFDARPLALGGQS